MRFIEIYNNGSRIKGLHAINSNRLFFSLLSNHSEYLSNFIHILISGVLLTSSFSIFSSFFVRSQFMLMSTLWSIILGIHSKHKTTNESRCHLRIENCELCSVVFNELSLYCTIEYKAWQQSKWLWKTEQDRNLLFIIITKGTPAMKSDKWCDEATDKSTQFEIRMRSQKEKHELKNEFRLLRNNNNNFSSLNKFFVFAMKI